MSQQPTMQEQALLNHIKRLERSGDEHLAVQVHLSKLIAFKTLPECVNVAITMMKRVAKVHDASLFQLANEDIFLVYHRGCVAQIDETLGRLSRVLKEDPFFSDGPAAEQEFCSHFDFAGGYEDLVGRAEALLEEKVKADSALRHNGGRRAEKRPLSLAGLAAVEKAITQADLSTMTSRQPVCEVDEDGRPLVLFHELFTSISALTDTLLPDENVFADRWLFQYLTAQLDQRMLAWLGKNDDATLRHTFSLNINIASLLSPRFLEFDGQLDQKRRNTIILELQIHDVFADVTRYLFAREFLLDRGYRICLDGVNELSLPFVHRSDLGAELVKLQWSPNLRRQIEGKQGAPIRAAIERITAPRIIFTRCESDDAIELGHELGVCLFQGFFLDHLLKEKITREEAAERLGAALSRHRQMTAPAAAAASS
ncbi:hypothetical protein [Pelagibius sp.]|uniref:hypothetical protein n=1 Tax=Pelagibius sp. TaxID=1931238 RepID=UPI003B505FFA